MALVDAVERNYEADFREADGAKQTLKHRTSYFVNEKGSVTVLKAERVTGVSRKHGKRWYRWEPADGHCIYKTKAGNVAGFSKHSNTFNGLIPFYQYRVDQRFNALVNEHIGPVDFHEVFPLAAHWNYEHQEELPTGLRGAFKHNDLKEFSIHLFGKTRYRKPLNKALAVANPSAIAVAHDFKGLVPIEWIIDFLRLNERPQDAEFLRVQVPSIRRYLMRIEPRSYRHLLQVPITRGDAWALSDMHGVERFRRVEIRGRARTWTELHDMVLPPINYRRPLELAADQPGVGPRITRTYTPPEMPKTIPLSELGKKMQGKKVGHLKVVIPTKPEQLKDWGNEMSNCIGSYVYNVAQKNAYQTLGAVYDGTKLLANFEISNGALRQLLGKANTQMKKDDRLAMEAFFTKHGVKVSNDYWGAQAL